MPILRELLTQAELDLLRLAALPVPLEEFLQLECPNPQACHLIVYNALSTIPGADVGPPKRAGSPGYASPYTDYEGWLAWFIRQPRKGQRRPRRPKVDPLPVPDVPSIGDRPNINDDAVRREIVNLWRQRHGLPPLAPSEPIPPVQSNDAPIPLHVWAPWQTPGQQPKKRSPRRPRQQGSQGQPRQLPRRSGRNPLEGLGGSHRASQRAETPYPQNPLSPPRPRQSRPFMVGDAVLFRGRERTIVRIVGPLIYLSSGASVYREDLTLIEGE